MFKRMEEHGEWIAVGFILGIAFAALIIGIANFADVREVQAQEAEELRICLKRWYDVDFALRVYEARNDADTLTELSLQFWSDHGSLYDEESKKPVGIFGADWTSRMVERMTRDVYQTNAYGVICKR